MIAQRAEGLAGHERIEALDAPAEHERPFRMRARQADQRAVRLVFERGVAGERAEDLRFFAAHHVRHRARCSTPGTICTVTPFAAFTLTMPFTSAGASAGVST